MKGGGQMDVNLFNYLEKTHHLNWNVKTIKEYVEQGANINAIIVGLDVSIAAYILRHTEGQDNYIEIHEYLQSLPNWKPPSFW